MKGISLKSSMFHEITLAEHVHLLHSLGLMATMVDFDIKIEI